MLIDVLSNYGHLHVFHMELSMGQVSCSLINKWFANKMWLCLVFILGFRGFPEEEEPEDDENNENYATDPDSTATQFLVNESHENAAHPPSSKDILFENNVFGQTDSSEDINLVSSSEQVVFLLLGTDCNYFWWYFIVVALFDFSC